MEGTLGAGTQGTKGHEGSHGVNPPRRGTNAAPRACIVLATCIRRRAENKGAPPPRFHPPRKGAGAAGRRQGDLGGTQDRPPRRRERRAASGGDAKQPEPCLETKNLSGERQLGRTWHGRNQRAQKGAREGGNPREESWEARTHTARGGGQGDKNPSKTLARNTTSGVGPPPPMTISAPRERGQSGGLHPGPLASGPWWHRPGGVANGPDQEHSPRHVLRFMSCEGLQVGHTGHRGRQETRLSRKDSPATHSVPDPGVGKGRRTWLRRRSICTKRVQIDGPYHKVTP